MTWRGLRNGVLIALGVVILAVSALGFAASLGEYAARPITRAGTVSLTVEGPSMGRVEAQGQARCVLEDDTNLAVQAGAGEGGTLQGTDGRRVAVELGLIGETEPGLTIEIDGRSASDARSSRASLSVAQSAGRYGGMLEFSGLVPRDRTLTPPLEDEAWHGTVTWQCSF